MSIKDLIEVLKLYSNQEAKVLITIGNEDIDTLSTSEFEVFSDTSDDGYIELFINEEVCSKQI